MISKAKLDVRLACRVAEPPNCLNRLQFPSTTFRRFRSSQPKAGRHRIRGDLHSQCGKHNFSGSYNGCGQDDANGNPCPIDGKTCRQHQPQRDRTKHSPAPARVSTGPAKHSFRVCRCLERTVSPPSTCSTSPASSLTTTSSRTVAHAHGPTVLGRLSKALRCAASTGFRCLPAGVHAGCNPRRWPTA